jgi:hypothetical protein
VADAETFDAVACCKQQKIYKAAATQQIIALFCIIREAIFTAQVSVILQPFSLSLFTSALRHLEQGWMNDYTTVV